MRTRLILPLALLAINVGGCRSSGEPPLPATLAITNVAVVDVERGIVVPGQRVLINGTRIVAVGPDDAIPTADSVVLLDGRGRFLIPGLRDMHAHIIERAGTIAAPLFVANGVTGVREMFSDGVEYLPWFRAVRDSIRRGTIIGPRLLLSSTPLDGPPGSESGVTLVHSATEARAAVDTSVAHGLDLAQSFPFLSRKAYLAAAERAQERGIAWGGLVPLAISFDEALASHHRARDYVGEWFRWCSTAGDSVEALLRAAADSDAVAPRTEARVWARQRASREHLFDTFSAGRCESLGRRLAADSVWQVPRLVIKRSHGMATPPDARRDSIRAQYAGPSTRTFWTSLRASPPTNARRREREALDRKQWARTREIVTTLHGAGIRFLAGTESGDLEVYPGFSLHDELAIFVELGMTPAQALRSATLEPARYLRATDSLGTISPGRIAHLVLLDRDPLADIAATRSIRAVVLNGRLFDSTAIAGMMTRAAAAAN